MLRVWAEHLPYPELRRPAVLDLLGRGPFHPLIAVRPEDDLDDLAASLKRLLHAGLEPGIWPLLDRAQGYWPSSETVLPFLARVDGLLVHLGSRGARPPWIAVDLEPPLRTVERLAHRPLIGAGELQRMSHTQF